MNPNNISGGSDSLDFDTNENYDLFNKNPYCLNFKDLLDNRGNVCNFYDEKSFLDKFRNQQGPLSSIGANKNFVCINSNIQSIASKFTSLCNFFDALNSANIFPDIFSLQETWTVNESSFDIPGYNFFYNTRKKGKGGGVGMYINEKYPVKVLNKTNFFVETIFESLAIEVEIPNVKKIIAVSLYRPNCHRRLSKSEQLEQFFIHFTAQLEYFSTLDSPIYFFTDSNLDIFKYGIDTNVNEYLDLLLTQGYLQFITKSTRIDGLSNTLIDHIFSNDNISNITSGVILDALSDHFLTFSVLNFNMKKKSQTFGLIRSFNSESKANFKAALANQHWTDVLEASCPDIAFNNFSEKYSTLFELYFPKKRVKLNKNTQPINLFMTPGLLISRKVKLKLARKAKKSPTAANVQKSRNFRNIYNKTLNACKKLYFQNKISDAGKNSKKVWDVINEATNSVSKKGSIDCIKIDNVLISDDLDMANNFNNFFSKIGPKTAEKVHHTDKNFRDYLPPPPLNSLFIQPVDENVIITTVNGMDKKSSKDINDISIKFLSEHLHEVAGPLAHIFNLSMQTGIFPSRMKTSKTVPIFKNVDSRLDPNNFRPVSIIDAWSKIFEKIVSIFLLAFLFQNNFFYKNQFGFLKGRSTDQAVLQIINYVTKELNEGKLAAACFLDVQKAFDTVNHEILYVKLENAGVRGVALNWFKSYLSERKQKVLIGSTFSDSIEDIILGVIQGSIIGVLLFLIFMNDIYKCSAALYSILFADDITSLLSSNNFDSLQTELNAELKNVCTWYRANKMVIHPKKSKLLVFRPNNRLIPDQFNIFLDDNEPGLFDPLKINKLKLITNSNDDIKDRSVRVLGVYLDEKLNFEYHIGHVKAKVNKAIFGLSRVKNIFSYESLRLIYFANIHSHLNYCNLMYCMVPKKFINKIFLAQKRAVRIICNESFRAHTSPLFFRSRILPLNDLIYFNCIKFMHDFNNGRLPEAFINTWTFNRDIEGYRLRNADNIYLPRFNYNSLRFHPFFYLPVFSKFDANI